MIRFSIRKAIAGHFWTVAPKVAAALRPPRLPPSRPWRTSVTRNDTGSLVPITGRLHQASGATELVVLLHGLGGSQDSDYILRATQVMLRAGVSCLRLNVRGADRSGADISHAGLTEDIAAAVVSPEVARYKRVYLVGYSVGGHMVLRYATEVLATNVRAVAAICPPLDLDRSATAIDTWHCTPYRHHVLRRLRQGYEAVVSRGGGTVSSASARRIATIREWDRLVVAPRFGFTSPEDYYAKASVGPRLGRLTCPALLILARFDPMVPLSSLSHLLSPATRRLTTRVVPQGGHVAFPSWVDLDLGNGSLRRGRGRGMEEQVLHWLRSQAAADRAATA